MVQKIKDNKKSSKDKKGSGESSANNNGGGGEENVRVRSVQATARSPERKTIAKRQKVPNPPKKTAKAESDHRRSVGSGGSAKLRKRKPKRTFKLHIYRVLKDVHHGEIRISKRGMDVMNSYCMDLFERIAAEAGELSKINKKQTLSLRDMQSATKMVLCHGELHLHALNEGKKAVKNMEMVGKMEVK
uniref:Histone domain-containing protein n=1 Tax=Meloidogyne hapla TaxID=6305 RepID=A0A1I8BKU3_MELHA